MPKVIYVESNGERLALDVPIGKSLMLAAQANNVSGILGECGGQLMCATCHVYVDAGFAAHLPPISEDEDAMLGETSAERRALSRLSCQLTASADIDGIALTIPETQA